MNRMRTIRGLVFSGMLGVLSLGFSGCNRTDPCASVTCVNGGVCNAQGKCNCPSGYEGNRCEVLTSDKFAGAWNNCTKTVATGSTIAICNNNSRFATTITALPAPCIGKLVINNPLNDDPTLQTQITADINSDGLTVTVPTQSINISTCSSPVLVFVTGTGIINGTSLTMNYSLTVGQNNAAVSIIMNRF